VAGVRQVGAVRRRGSRGLADLLFSRASGRLSRKVCIGVLRMLKANRRGSLNQDRYRAAIGGLARLINLLRIPER